MCIRDRRRVHGNRDMTAKLRMEISKIKGRYVDELEQVREDSVQAYLDKMQTFKEDFINKQNENFRLIKEMGQLKKEIAEINKDMIKSYERLQKVEDKMFGAQVFRLGVDDETREQFDNLSLYNINP
eukprot:TRINITY_DN11795_c0_g1_i1.p2 TRINITY_DN11795_c0_g1~~TRINITY_DN11795_c0_g1_i1.p2  ORF type:complete len:127 (-),score=31.09 TRINITY_DN11795_c0_g1_i1:275-655(-)